MIPVIILGFAFIYAVTKQFIIKPVFGIIFWLIADDEPKDKIINDMKTINIRPVERQARQPIQEQQVAIRHEVSTEYQGEVKLW